MPKAWILLTPAHLKSAMTSKEVADFGKSVTDGDPDDRILPILADVTQDLRGRIKSWRQNTLSADDTLIPAEFKSQALAIARWNVLTSIPGYQPGAAREKAYDEALAFFRDVAKGINRPEEATDAVKPEVAEQQAHPTPRMSGRGRRFTRETQDGI